MRLQDILRRKGAEVVTVGPDATVLDAVRRMNEHKIGATVVTDADGGVLGIISERDVLHMCGERCGSSAEAKAAGDPWESPVADLMTEDVIIALPEDTIDYAMGIMTQNRVRHLPVLEEGLLAGIVSIGDVVREILHEAEYENRALRSYIQGTATH
jgi:CBS domain-containing protein